MRHLLKTKFQLAEIFDLGDTKIFAAAVLPAVVTGFREGISDPIDRSGPKRQTKFHRIYRVEDACDSEKPQAASLGSETVLELIDNESKIGGFAADSCRVSIERGELIAGENDSVWTLINSASRRWLDQVRKTQVRCFDDVVDIKVGIKTTADSVFIRDDWSEFDGFDREKKLLRPLITHHDARRWEIETPGRRVLYPYDCRADQRSVIELKQFPTIAGYLASHRERLEGRQYVVDGGAEVVRDLGASSAKIVGGTEDRLA